MLPVQIQITLKVTGTLDRLGIPYLVGGSLASAVHGVVRATMDADLVADVRLEHVVPLVDRLKDEFYIDLDMILDAIQSQSSFNLIHLDTMFKVDIFILKQRPFDIHQMGRRVLQNIGDEPGITAYFSTAEDIILAKLEWFRTGGEVSERQWRDVLGVIGTQADHLDYAYLHRWAATLGVEDLLRRALGEGNPPQGI